MFKRLIASAVILAAPISAPAQEKDVYTPVWNQFVEARKTGAEPVLPDFSYAGYHYGEKAIPHVQGPVFDVTKFGAIPNDDKSDEEALRRAFAAAERAGGGVVLFPAGEFLFNTETDPGKPIEVNAGNIVMRGAGFGRDGTILRVVRHFEAADPTKMYSTPFYFRFKAKGTLGTGRELAAVTGEARRETYTVTVNDASKLKPGMRVTLRMQNKDAVPEFLKPFDAAPEWTRILSDGILVTERHKIAKIDGNTVTFHEPLHTSVNPALGWTLRNYEPMEEIGIEDLCFMGGYVQDFVHHRSAYDDGAWSMLWLEGVANSWVRRCAFINTSNAIEVRSSSQLSVLQVIIEGNPSHFGMHTRAGYGVLGGLMEYRQWTWHGPSVGYQAVNTVYWRCVMKPEQRVDSHSGQPYATLHDNTWGGILYGSGGPTAGLPHHLRHWVLWNFKYQGNMNWNYDFWGPKKDKFVMPIIVGFHGTPVKFNEKRLELLESHGTPVKPESLWEAQLALRLGGLPEWVEKAKEDWKVLRETPLPDWQRGPSDVPGTADANDDDKAKQET